MKVSGKDIADKIYQTLRNRVEELKKKNIIPHLLVFLIGESPASVVYVNQKEKKGEEIGCKITVLRFDESITTEELEKKVKLLNEDPFVHGILIQRPVPAHIDIDKLVELTDPKKDIDGFHPDSPYILPLPLAVIKILKEVYEETKGTKETKVEKTSVPSVSSDSFNTFIDWLASQKIVITGKGPTGGGPIIKYLQTLNVTLHVIDSKTQNPKDLLKQADILIAAVGRENMIHASDLKQGVILIGVGILRGLDGKLHGDYNEEEIENVASYYTPTPGGVGPVNVAMLMDNLLTATEKQS